MLELMKPREYQEEAIAAAFDARDRGVRCFSSVLATGLGKTVIFSHVAYRLHAAGQRSAVIVHRDELVKQTVAKLRSIAPHLTVSVVKGAEKNFSGDVVVMSVQTVGRNDGKTLSSVSPEYFDWITIDECHHAAARSYQNIIKYFYSATIAGYTATLTRTDKLGLGDTFTENVFTRDIMFGIRSGYLVNPRGYVIKLNIGKGDLTGGKDYTDRSTSEALLKANAIEVYTHVIRERVPDRQGVVFMPSVATGTQMVDALNAAGFSAEGVFQSTTSSERDLIFERVTKGETQILVNCMVLTEGFDLPQISFVLVRPTKSSGLFVQMVGRGLRPSDAHDPDSPYPWLRKPKSDCVVLCPQGIDDLNLATMVDLSPTQISTYREGESLTEAREREEITEKADMESVNVESVDLFAASHYVWLTTKGRGYHFIPAGDVLVAVLPEYADSVTFKVGTVSVGPGRPRKGEKIGSGMSFDEARAYAEVAALRLDPKGTYSKLKAPWRTRKKSPATSGQITYARKLGASVPDDVNRATVADIISTELASSALDRYVPPNTSPDENH